MIGIALMLNPWELSSGLFFDTRTILLSVAGFFFGFIPAVVGVVIVSSYRFYEGGTGVVIGIATSVSSVILGLLWRQFHEKLHELFGRFELYILGIVVHIFMLLCMFLLPLQYALEVLRSISFPVMLIYPIGTVLLGSLLSNQLSRKKAKETLKQAELKYRQAYNLMQDVIESPKNVIIFALDREYKYISFNKNHQVTMEHIWDAKIEVGVSMLSYIKDPSDREKSKVNFDRALTGEAFTTVEEYGEIDFERRWYENVYSPLEDDEGNILGITLFLTDITERKESEMALVKAKLLAEESSRTKSEFLANMSHELRTPLNSVIGFSQILIDKIAGDLNESQMNYALNIQRSGNHLLEVITDILEMSKIESGNMKYEPEIINIRQIIDEVGLLMEPMIKTKSIDLKLNMEFEDLEIYADKIKIKQIMYNLLSNAIKFTPEHGKVRIDAKISYDILQVSVSDTGIGIPPKEQKEIFNPFKQVNSSANRVHDGTGLGLAIVKHYVEIHSGEIQVESEVGKGSAFTFTIPLNTNFKNNN